MRAHVMKLALAITLAPVHAWAIEPAGGAEAPKLLKAAPNPPAPTPAAVAPSTPPPPPGTAKAPVPPADAAEPASAEPLDLSGTWTYNHGGAPRPRYVRTRADAEARTNPEGYYSGVSIGGNHVPPFPARKLGSKPASLTWTGFERTGEVSRVFFEMSADVATDLAVRGNVITLRIINTRVNVRNNARVLDLSFFSTPVRSVKVTRRGRDTVATIVLKRASTPTVSWVPGKAGYRLLVVDFSGTEAAD